MKLLRTQRELAERESHNAIVSNDAVRGNRSLDRVNGSGLVAAARQQGQDEKEFSHRPMDTQSAIRTPTNYDLQFVGLRDA